MPSSALRGTGMPPHTISGSYCMCANAPCINKVSVLIENQNPKCALLCPKGHRSSPTHFELLTVCVQMYNAKIKYHGSHRESKSKMCPLQPQGAQAEHNTLSSVRVQMHSAKIKSCGSCGQSKSQMGPTGHRQ